MPEEIRLDRKNARPGKLLSNDLHKYFDRLPKTEVRSLLAGRIF